jgi:hypothetical protein
MVPPVAPALRAKDKLDHKPPADRHDRHIEDEHDDEDGENKYARFLEFRKQIHWLSFPLAGWMDMGKA